MGSSRKAPIIFKGLLVLLAFFLVLAAGMAIFNGIVCRHGIPTELKAAPIAPPRQVTPARPWRNGGRDASAPAISAIQGADDYLKLLAALNPSYPAVQILRELTQQFSRIQAETSNLFLKRDDAITSAEAQWLRGQGDYFALLHQLAEAGPPPSLTFQELQAEIKKNGDNTSWIHPADYLNMWGTIHLGYKARLCLQEHDPAGARQALRDAIRLAVNLSENERFIDRLYANACLGRATGIAELLVKQAKPGDEELQVLLKDLARAGAAMLTTDTLNRSLTYLYLEQRCAIVTQMEQPTWRQPIYGWDPERKQEEFEGYHFFNQSMWLPKPKRMLPIALTAIRNRMESTQALRQYDEYFRQATAAAEKPYPDCLKSVGALKDSPLMKCYLLEKYQTDIIPLKIWSLIPETRSQLCQLGLAWRQDPGEFLNRQTGDFTGRPHDPWRDPFTEKPLRVDDTSSPTLIYSLGPDLKDQQGAIAYDPSNGTVSGGDILLRLPR